MLLIKGSSDGVWMNNVFTADLQGRCRSFIDRFLLHRSPGHSDLSACDALELQLPACNARNRHLPVPCDLLALSLLIGYTGCSSDKSEVLIGRTFAACPSLKTVGTLPALGPATW
jgi:hypothetical protein